MRIRLQTLLVLILIVAVLAVKIFFVAQTVSPSYESFYGIRQIEHIRETGLPLLTDELSYQGRSHVSGALFYYVTAFFSFFIPIFALFKYGGVVLGCFALWLIYLLARRLFIDRWIAVLVTFLAALTPLVFTAHLNTLTSSSFFLVCYLGLLYLFVSLKKKQNVLFFVILLVLVTLSSSLVLVAILGFLLYLLLIKLESLALRNKESELLVFGTLFVLWYHLLVYKKLFFLYGADAIWQNIPSQLLASSFQKVTMAAVLSFVGFLPLVLGLYGIYLALFQEKRRWLLLLLGQIFSFGLLIWLGFFQFQEGLFFVTILLIFMGGYAIKQTVRTLNKTVITSLKPLLAAVFVLIVLASFLPIIFYQGALVADSPSREDLQVMVSLRELSPEDATVLAHIQEGHLITAVAKRKNFYDTNYVLAPQVEQRYTDAQTIFLSQSKTTALSLLDYYDIDYIFISSKTLDQYEQSTLPLMQDKDCFAPLLITTTSTLYEVRCNLEN